MKRSEMIKRLQKRFYFGESEVIADLADEIIDFLVSQSMLPPKRIKYAPTAYAEPNKKVVYEWEPEDDQH